MPRRICINPVEGPSGETVVIAWPWSNDPADLNAAVAETVSRALGGLPVVLLARSRGGDLHTFGSHEHTAILVGLDLACVSWNYIDVEDGQPPRLSPATPAAA